MPRGERAGAVQPEPGLWHDLARLVRAVQYLRYSGALQQHDPSRQQLRLQPVHDRRELADTKLTSIRPLSEVPLFMDAVFVDFEPVNGSEAMPVQPPPDLRGGDVRASGNEHWRFLIARHKRGINVGMADGSVRWTPLEEMYTLQWKSNWVKYRLSLPSY